MLDATKKIISLLEDSGISVSSHTRDLDRIVKNAINDKIEVCATRAETEYTSDEYSDWGESMQALAAKNIAKEIRSLKVQV